MLYFSMKYAIGGLGTPPKNMSTNHQDPQVAKANSEEFFNEFDPDRTHTIVSMKPEHSDSIVNLDQVDLEEYEQTYLGPQVLCDAFFTTQKLILTVRPADCAILTLSSLDPSNQLNGMIHLGWRSVLMDLGYKVTREICDVIGIDPALISVQVSPHIRRSNMDFEHLEVPNRHPEHLPYFTKDSPDDAYRYDITTDIVNQLVRAGIKKENILDEGLDNYELAKDHKAFSHKLSTNNSDYKNGRFAVASLID